MAKIHMILQGKGGVGKSMIAATLAQWKRAHGEAPLCIDTDPVNATFAGCLVARYGGDEFMVFTEDADSAASLAEVVRSTVAVQFDVERNRIRTLCAEAGMTEPAPAPLLTVTISIVNLAHHNGLSRALNAVDEANDRAEVAGSNRVVN